MKNIDDDDFIIVYEGNIEDTPYASEEATKEFMEYYEIVEGSYSDLHNQYLQELKDIKRNMILREYKSTDCNEIRELFYNTVNAINAEDYTEEQLYAWTGSNFDTEELDKSLKQNYTVVAVLGDKIVGFGDIEESGYLDRFFVHKDYQMLGIGTRICDRLESKISGKISIHSSITAKPFFESKGYKVIKEQQITRNGVTLINFVMEKYK